MPGFHVVDDVLILSSVAHCVDRDPFRAGINQLCKGVSGECATQRVGFLRAHPIDEMK
jgi:hypothetical protein